MSFSIFLQKYWRNDCSVIHHLALISDVPMKSKSEDCGDYICISDSQDYQYIINMIELHANYIADKSTKPNYQNHAMCLFCKLQTAVLVFSESQWCANIPGCWDISCIKYKKLCEVEHLWFHFCNMLSHMTRTDIYKTLDE